MGEVYFEPGDVLTLYTDGVTEAMNDAAEEFGEERLEQCIIKNRDRSPREILETVEAEVRAFTGPRATLDDDLTLVVVKFS